MIIYLAGASTKYGIALKEVSFELESFYTFKTNFRNEERIFAFFNSDRKGFFLDSGAFSAWSKGHKIDIDEYISFIKKYKEYISVYSVLDVIGSAKDTMKNQQYMQRQGLTPLPCFHYGEDEKFFIHYINNYDYVALGGMVPVPNERLQLWLDHLFGSVLLKHKKDTPVKIHGFGMTSIPLLIRYPWFSVDSTSWLMGMKFGKIFLPKKDKNGYSFFCPPYTILITEEARQNKDHFNYLSDKNKKEITEYFLKKGFDAKEVESSYRKRNSLNICYFNDLENNLPEWPWIFEIKNQSLF